MIPDLDIYRSANVLVKHHGQDALSRDMEQRFAALGEGAHTRIYKLPVNRIARLINEFPLRKVEIFETLNGAKNAALAIASRVQAKGNPKISMFATRPTPQRPTPQNEELRKTLSKLTEDRVETYYF